MYLTPPKAAYKKKVSFRIHPSYVQNESICPPNYLTPIRKPCSLDQSNASSNQHNQEEPKEDLRKYSSNFYKNTRYNAILKQQTLEHDLRGEHNEVIFKFFNCIKHVRLARLRLYLLLANLIVLGATYLSFKSWIHIVGIRRDYVDHFHINDWLQNPIGILVQTSIMRIDLFFVLSSCSLSLYYAIFGVYVSLNYGSGQTDQLCAILACPIVIILSLTQVGMAWISFRINETLNELDCSILQFKISYNLLATLVDLKHYMQQHSILLVVLYIASAVVQLITVLLPWCLHDLPFQRMMNCEEAALRNANRTINGEVLDMSQPIYLGPSSAALVMITLCKPELKAYHLRRLLDSCD